MTPIRLLHLANESSPDPIRQEVQVRAAFEQYRAEGVIGEIRTIPVPLECERRGSARVLADILEAVDVFKPDLIFWQNVDLFPVTRDYLRQLKGRACRPRLVYYDGDPYGRLQCRMPAPARAMMAEADMVCLVGLGGFADLAHRFGARHVLYTPFGFDRLRFGGEWTPTLDRRDSVCMIGSLWRSRLPFVFIPGARGRKQVAGLLTARFGASFALYGANWGRLPSFRGPVPFHQQQDVIREAWVSVGWNHFTDTAFYFSDRLPISLAAGVPHITSWHPGYDSFFAGCPGLYMAKTPEEACDLADFVLAKPREERVALGQQCREWAFQHLEATVVFRGLLDHCLRLLETRSTP
jgi:hypothetical protein